MRRPFRPAADRASAAAGLASLVAGTEAGPVGKSKGLQRNSFIPDFVKLTMGTSRVSDDRGY